MDSTCSPAGLRPSTRPTTPTPAKPQTTPRSAAYRHEEKVIHHPDAGILTLDCDVLAADNNELRLAVYTARRRSETSDRLQQLEEALAQTRDSRQRPLQV
jgi:hypothetical protein